MQNSILKPLTSQSFQSLRKNWLNQCRKDGFELDEGQYQRSSASGKVSYVFLRPKSWHSMLLLCHGTGNDLLFGWQALIEAALRQGKAVFSFDLDGHGLESTTLLSRQTLGTCLSDAQSFAQTLGMRPSHFDIVAYSLGGYLAARAVAREELRPRRLALLAVAESIRFSAGFVMNEAAGILHPEFRTLCANYGWRECLPAFGSFRRADFPIRKAPEEKRSYPLLVSDIFQEQSLSAILSDIPCPTLLLHGGRDRLAPPFFTGKKPDGLIETRVIDSSNHFLLPCLKESTATLCTWME